MGYNNDMNSKVIQDQKRICEKYKADFKDSDPDLMVGVADNFFDKDKPLNGLRHPETEDATGWFLWAGGEPSSEPDFFKPMHLKHLAKSRPEIIQYLGLAPGWRFLIDLPNNYEDVWEDKTLLIED
jgi:hypothetical protein